jgi:hypothetical protein
MVKAMMETSKRAKEPQRAAGGCKAVIPLAEYLPELLPEKRIISQ